MEIINDNGLVPSYGMCNNDKVKKAFPESVYVWIHHNYDTGEQVELCERENLMWRSDVRPIEGDQYGNDVVPAPTAEEIIAECKRVKDIKVLEDGWMVDSEMKSISTRNENLATALLNFWFKI